MKRPKSRARWSRRVPKLSSLLRGGVGETQIGSGLRLHKRTNEQSSGSQAKGHKAGDVLVPMQEEEGNDCSQRSHHHCQISPHDGGTLPVQPSNYADECAGEEDGSGNVQVQINRTWRCVVQSPEHQEEADKEVRNSIHQNLRT